MKERINMKKFDNKLDGNNENKMNSQQRSNNSGQKRAKDSKKYNPKKDKTKASSDSTSIISTTLNAILADTAAINFPSRTGNEYKMGEWFLTTDPTPQSNPTRLSYIQPGIMKISYIPTYGVVKDSHSGINAISTKIYTTMRTFQTGSTNYDAADLIGYICAWDQCNAVVAFIKRLLRFANTWIMNNTYTPKALIESQGINFEDTVTKLTEYRARLNRIIFQLNTFYVPNVLPIIERHQQMCENFYMDRADTTKAQFIYFYPSDFFKLSMNTASPTSLELVSTPTSTYDTHAATVTIGKLLDFLQNMLSELVNNSIVDTMSGDLQRSFGPEKQRLCYILEADSYGIPVYDEALLNAVHNLKVINYSSIEPTSIKYFVDAETNMFKFAPVAKETRSAGFPTEKTLYTVDFDTDTPSALEIIDTARFITGYDKTNGLLLGSEWFTDIHVITKPLQKDRTGNKQYSTKSISAFELSWYEALSQREDATDLLKPPVLDFLYLLPFRKAPIMPYVIIDAIGDLENMFFVGETNNLGTIETSNLFAIDRKSVV